MAKLIRVFRDPTAIHIVDGRVEIVKDGQAAGDDGNFSLKIKADGKLHFDKMVSSVWESAVKHDYP